MSNISILQNKSSPADFSATETPRPGLFLRFLQALHHSRRLQARRTLRQYHHLIDRGWQRFDQLSIGGRDNVDQ